MEPFEVGSGHFCRSTWLHVAVGAGRTDLLPQTRRVFPGLLVDLCSTSSGLMSLVLSQLCVPLIRSWTDTMSPSYLLLLPGQLSRCVSRATYLQVIVTD